VIEIEGLRYVRLGTQDLPAAIDYAQRILGLELVEKSGVHAAFRSDFRDRTLIYALGDPAEQSVAFEVRGIDVLERAVTQLQQNGYAVTRGSERDAEQRKVRTFAAFNDNSGNSIELVVRPLATGWRYFAARDAGVTGLEAVALRTRDGADETLWTTLFNGRVSDWVGDAAYIRFDDAHHRLALHPSGRAGVLAVEYAVEGVDQLMQSMYYLQSAQIKIVHGPGRRPTSDQMFLTFTGPDGLLFSYVTQGRRIADDAAHRPRQFARVSRSFCSWGSESDLPEFGAGD
jgi:2,3-dihydroxy-p-cumate/2,3-dihydroxybenzoate 3,4-dioxygenase